MSSAVWCYLETRQGELLKGALELAGCALELGKALGGTAAAVLCGHGIDRAVGQAASCGLDRIYVIEGERVEKYNPLVYTRNVAALVAAKKPDIFLLPASVQGTDLAARVAASLRTGLTAHCVDLRIEEVEGQKLLVQVVPGWGGSFMLKIACPQARPQMATLAAGVFRPARQAAASAPEIERIPVAVGEEDSSIELLEEVPFADERLALEQASVVVCGGWGLRSSGSFQLVEELASALGGEVAGTRPAVDAGWVSEDRMIGVSGKTVRPKLFVSVGASGSPHYTAGFDRSDVILAIDRDRQARIFRLCDVGIVGDLRQVIPALVRELSEASADGP